MVLPLKKEKELVDIKDANFDFFGTNIGFNIPYGMNEARFYPQTQKGIENFFNLASVSPHEDLLKYIKSVCEDLHLNDWGKYLLIKKMGKSIFPIEDDARLFTWFIFNKLGYALRVGLVEKHVLVMYASEKIIYATPSYFIDKKSFYILSQYAKGKIGKIFTYEKNYPEANKYFDLALQTLPTFVANKERKSIHFTKENKKYRINYTYNKNVIDFMATYPQADYETYFNAPLEDTTYKEIAKQLKLIVDTKRSSVAIDFLLSFVQNAFAYEVDATQFSREKVMFAQETLFYDKSDCEDRAILFAYLVRAILNIGVVGVKYKDHMATALYIPMQGDSVRVGSKKYIIADPTYINASIGQSMPKYKRVKPEGFILLH
ncbi:hypothetical protein JHD48_08065 [Sulfurimonas sp. SAG-AH-194-I05]|nr:hypothetical protein [Sulfurimonas sp. SAG-AH-194-I05]